MVGEHLMQRFFEKVEKTSYCWNWTGYVTESGYGQFRYMGKTQRAHRVSYELAYGSIKDNFVIDHLCKNRKCVNPKHLDLVKQIENIRRGLSGKINNAQSRKTHCPKGHEYSRKTKHGYRLCGKRRSEQTLKSRNGKQLH
jgi:hypothetical protein